jgi:hypothetical protein
VLKTQICVTRPQCVKDRESEPFVSFQKQNLMILEGIQKQTHQTFSEEFFGLVELPILVPQCAFVTSSTKQS